jgi:ATP-binding cassette subfamily B protein/subfamily B ATP-binding cassette protein MsbA
MSLDLTAPDSQAALREQRSPKRPSLDEIFGSEQAEQAVRPLDRALLARIWVFIRPYRRPLTISLVLMAGTNAASVAGPYLAGRAVDAVAKGELGLVGQVLPGVIRTPTDALSAWVVLMGVVLVLEWVTNRARLYIMADVGTRVVVDVRGAMFEHLQRLSVSFYDNYKVGRLMSRIVGDVQVLQEFVTWTIVGTARSLFTLVFIVITLLYLNWQLALLVLLVLPPMVLLTRRWSARTREAWREVRRRIAIINGYLNETVTGVRVVQSYTREPVNERTFDELNRRHLDANIEAARLAASFFPAVDVLGSIAVAIVVAYGAFAPPGTFTPGELTAFALLVDRFFDPIRELSRRYNQLLGTMAAGERVFELLDLAPEVPDAPDAQLLPRIHGHVRFEDVVFAYGEVPVLKSITLDVPAGTTVALVGQTGAGKTSLINVLGRFYDIQSGRVTIDGHDIRQVTKASLRSQLGVVLQETFLFGGTIADNIRYGRLDATPAAIEEAARSVGAHDFIMALPSGYDTEVGERGVNLSVGQRQLLAFARALLADPRILILDEATASIDTETEQLIQRALTRLLAGRTAFVIAHRLSTVTAADLLVVVDGGRIAEQGSHAELLAARGLYYRLYTMQWAAGQSAAAI